MHPWAVTVADFGSRFQSGDAFAQPFFPKEGGSSLVVFSIPARGVLIGSKKWQKQKPARFQNLILNFTGLFLRPKKMAEKVVRGFCSGISEKVLWDFFCGF